MGQGLLNIDHSPVLFLGLVLPLLSNTDRVYFGRSAHTYSHIATSVTLPKLRRKQSLSIVTPDAESCLSGVRVV